MNNSDPSAQYDPRRMQPVPGHPHGALACAMAASPISKLEQKFEPLRQGVADLTCMILDLENRLSPVLASVPESDTGKEPAPLPRCQLDELVNEINQRISHACRQVAAIHDRLCV